MRFALSLTFLALLAGACASSPGSRRISSYESPEEELLLAINAYRTSNSAPALMEDSTLQQAAVKHAAYLKEKSLYTHRGPEGAEGVMKRVWNAGGKDKFDAAAENLSCDTPDAQMVLKSWIESDGHRRNLLLNPATHAGLAHLANPGAECPHLWVLVVGTARK